MPGGDPGSYGSTFDLVAVFQDVDDAFAVHRVHLFPGVRGYDEARLVGNIGGASNVAGDLGVIADNDVLSWSLEAGATALNGFPAVTLFDIGREASFDWVTAIPSVTGTPVVAELRAVTPVVLGTSGGNLIGSTIGSPQNVTLPPNVLRAFQQIRLQGYYIDASLSANWPFQATNEIWCHYFDEASSDVLIEAEGPNSANNGLPGTTTPPLQPPFWRVTSRTGLPIVRVTFDMSSSPDRGIRDAMRFDIFDTFQPGGVATQTSFHRGNSNLATCAGTYRNGSEVATGLVFDGTNHPVDACAAGFDSGFRAANEYDGVPNTWRTITFRFTDFIGSAGAPEVFEFDCDTDGGNGITGGDMADIVVEVEFLGGEVRRTMLRADPNNAFRSVAGV